MEDMTSSAEFDLLLVPGVAFDARCNRLGHGKGYYDSFIQQTRARVGRGAGSNSNNGGGGGGVTSPIIVGLALSPQVVEMVPVGEQDQRLDFVVSAEGSFAYASVAGDYAHGGGWLSADLPFEWHGFSMCAFSACMLLMK